MVGVICEDIELIKKNIIDCESLVHAKGTKVVGCIRDC